MFPDDLRAALADYAIPTEPVSFVRSPFPVYRLGATTVRLHLIDFATYRTLAERTDATYFFQGLSDTAGGPGQPLIHIWEDVWRAKPAVVLSRLRAQAGDSVRIPARLTLVRRIDRPTADRFLAEHHLQVPVTAKHKYGLFLPRRYFRVLPPDRAPDADEWLVAVATFAHARQFRRNDGIHRDGLHRDDIHRSIELVRFANRLGHTVVGGLDKLLNALVTEQQPDDVMTYADRDWSDGRSYERLGFARVGTTDPQQFWLDPRDMTRHYPHRLADPTGYVPVYNAGSIKFVKVIPGHSLRDIR